jgi:adenylate cyclase
LRRFTGIREIGLAAIVAVAILALLSFTQPMLLRGLETASLDLRFRIRGPQPPGPEVAIVLVDDRSVDALGGWPLSHRLFADALGVLDRDGAQFIVFDLLFAQTERGISPQVRAAAREAAKALPQEGDANLKSALRVLADDDPDGEFEKALRASGKVFLPIAFAFAGAPTETPPFVADSGYQRFDKTPEKPVFPLQPVSVITPLAQWATAALGLGHVNIAFDRDGAPRYDYVALPFQGDFLPALPVRVAAARLGVDWASVGLALGEGVHIGQVTIPTDNAMRLVINYNGPRGTFPTYSFVDLVQGRVPSDALKGRIVLIGASFIGMADANASPFGPTPLPGTERMADILDTILHQRFIAEAPSPWPVLIILMVLLTAMLTGATTAFLPTRSAMLAGVVPIGLWCFGAQLAFVNGLWLPLIVPLIALAAAMVAVLLYRYWVVDAEGRTVKSAFRHYLAPEMVDVLARNPQLLKLGGETRTLTILFSDIRGFTSIAEQYKSNPQGLTRLINRSFLSPMTELIMARRGTIDKYMGDCVMAFWNAPLDDIAHADDACESALAMVAALERLNNELREEATAEGRSFHEIRIGIGVNTGDCVVGNMGSEQRLAYTAIGDAVNLASRLEGQTKEYRVDIIIGEATRKAAPSWAALELDWIAVKGKDEAPSIYALIGDRDLAQSAEFKTLAARHEAMLGCYRRQDWAGAMAALNRCRRSGNSLSRLYDLYEERIAYYTENPPGPSWDGVFVATAK